MHDSSTMMIWVYLNELKNFLVLMANTSLSLLLVLSIYSVIGTTRFRDVFPDQFGYFEQSFTTLMLIMIGELRPESFGNVNRSDDAVSAMDGIYFMSFVAIINWGIFHFFLNVCFNCMIATWKRREIYNRRRQIHTNQQKLKEISKMIQESMYARERNQDENIEETNQQLQEIFQNSCPSAFFSDSLFQDPTTNNSTQHEESNLPARMAAASTRSVGTAASKIAAGYRNRIQHIIDMELAVIAARRDVAHIRSLIRRLGPTFPPAHHPGPAWVHPAAAATARTCGGREARKQGRLG